MERQGSIFQTRLQLRSDAFGSWWLGLCLPAISALFSGTATELCRNQELAVPVQRGRARPFEAGSCGELGPELSKAALGAGRLQGTAAWAKEVEWRGSRAAGRAG